MYRVPCDIGGDEFTEQNHGGYAQGRSRVVQTTLGADEGFANAQDGAGETKGVGAHPRYPGDTLCVCRAYLNEVRARGAELPPAILEPSLV